MLEGWIGRVSSKEGFINQQNSTDAGLVGIKSINWIAGLIKQKIWNRLTICGEEGSCYDLTIKPKCNLNHCNLRRHNSVGIRLLRSRPCKQGLSSGSNSIWMEALNQQLGISKCFDNSSMGQIGAGDQHIISRWSKWHPVK